MSSDPTNSIIGAAIEVHKHFGPGLVETTYQACLAFELAERSLSFLREPFVSINYKALTIERAFRPDFIVEGSVVVELKHIEKVLAVHEAQLRTYLKLTGVPTGLLLNFNTVVMKNGIRRIDLKDP